MGLAYYNENDPAAAAWLRELIKEKLIAPGVVDTRSIEDIKPDELKPFIQCHFFAGIGVWSYALRQAGWPDDRPVWSGSCPCQPFSATGKGGGFNDERHLWPAWEYLVGQRSPAVIFGEQVASPDGLAWLDLVQLDLEKQGYAVGANDLCAAGVGAPHIRQRLWFVACRMGDAVRARLERYAGNGGHRGKPGRHDANASRPATPAGVSMSLADGGPGASGAAKGFWSGADWLGCRDGKYRAVQPGTFPLVDGFTARVELLRGYGNSINAEVAKTFILSYLDSERVSNI